VLRSKMPRRLQVALEVPTDPSWVSLAVERFDEVLVDHAHCEKKAAANALSLLQAYPDVPGLPAQMARMAREESAHLARVLALIERRGLTLSRDRGDPYAQALQQLVKGRLDKLLVAAIIEARSCERLELLAGALADPELKAFYAELAQSEDGHQELFLRLACSAHGEPEALARLNVLTAAEAGIVRSLPIRAAIH
jgi:tRNA-(ms[2]io[6]A)-hydroxylase